jgi:Na+-driven multidrug efflux pump
MRKKIKEYFPAMLMTNLSTLMLISVDSLVAGNLLGEDALSSVSIFYPVTVLVGAYTALVALGISTSISTALGSNNQERIDIVGAASLKLMIVMAAIVSVIQIPFVAAVINSYHLSPEMKSLVWQYAIGIMICSPLGLISAVGVYQMQIEGMMKTLTILSVIESAANLSFDLLFVVVLNMGLVGNGFGTACANLLRCSLTIFILSKRADMYRRAKNKTTFKDYMDILRCGAPDASYTLMLAVQAYFIMKLLLEVFGSDGGIVYGVCMFCLNLTYVIITAIQGSMRPLVGLLAGAEDRKGLSKLMNTGFRINAAGTGLCTLIVLLVPVFFYKVHGVDVIPEDGILSLRLFSLYFVFKGSNTLIRLYLSNRKDSDFATRVTVIGYGFLLAVAYILSKLCPPPYLWLAYLISETAVFAVFYSRFKWWKSKDKKDDDADGDDPVLYLTVKPDQAVEASRALRRYADELGKSPRISYRVALCMEELVAYAKDMKGGSNNDISVQIIVRFKGDNAATFIALDDGAAIEPDPDESKRELTANNYNLLRRIAASVDYQYVLDMNYTTLTFNA